MIYLRQLTLREETIINMFNHLIIILKVSDNRLVWEKTPGGYSLAA